MISSLNPWEFLQFVQGVPLYNFPICKLYPAAQLLEMIEARVSAWLHGRFVESEVPPVTLARLRKMEKKYKEVVYARWV
jgi:hypothetical protein